MTNRQPHLVCVFSFALDKLCLVVKAALEQCILVQTNEIVQRLHRPSHFSHVVFVVKRNKSRISTHCGDKAPNRHNH